MLVIFVLMHDVCIAFKKQGFIISKAIYRICVDIWKLSGK